MANLRVVSITDHERVRARADLLVDLVRYTSKIADELHDIDARLRALRGMLEHVQQGGGSTQSSV
jgi:hypothetical protein